MGEEGKWGEEAEEVTLTGAHCLALVKPRSLSESCSQDSTSQSHSNPPVD